MQIDEGADVVLREAEGVGWRNVYLTRTRGKVRGRSVFPSTAIP
jgi:hypothetical protein